MKHLHEKFRSTAFRELLKKNDFGIKENICDEELAEHLKTYPLYMNYMRKSLFDTFVKANGLTPELLDQLSKLRQETNLYTYLSRGNSKVLERLEEPHSFFELFLEDALKIGNPAIFLVTSETEEGSNEPVSSPLMGALIFYSRITDACQRNKELLSYDKEFSEALDHVLSRARNLKLEIFDYLSKNAPDEESDDIDNIYASQEVFIHSLDRLSHQALPSEMQNMLLDAWEPMLHRHKVLLETYFNPGEDSVDTSEDAIKTREVFKKVCEEFITDPQVSDRILEGVRDVILSLMTKVEGIRILCGNVPMPDFVLPYEKMVKEYTPKILQSLN